MSYSLRMSTLKNKLAEINLHGMYITNLTNVRYLTGFTGSAGSLLVLEDDQHFFTDGRYIEQSKSQVKNSKIHIVGSSHYQTIKKKSLIPNDVKIGIEANFVSIGLYDQITDILSHVVWEKLDDIIGVLAAVKDAGEIQSLKTAIEITDTVFSEIIPELFFLLLIDTFKPVFSSKTFCRSNIFGSFLLTNLNFLLLNCLAKTSACLTENFFCIIFLASSTEFCNPIKVLACPADKFPCSTINKISLLRDNNLNEFAI